MVSKFEELVRTFCYDCENNSFIKCNHCFDMYKEKHNMFKSADQVEINVRVNGVETPLHRISKQTLLTVRENSKSKEVPVARVADYESGKRLILKVSDSIKRRIDAGSQVIAIDLGCGSVVGSWQLEDDQKPGFSGVHLYHNIQTIS